MTEDTTLWPPESHAYKELSKLVDYGATLQWDLICEALGFGVEASLLPRSWEFNKAWFKLVDMFKRDGFMVTEAGMHQKGIRVLGREEMAGAVAKIQNREANNTLKRSATLSKVPRDGMEETEVKSLDHWEEKTAVLGLTQKHLIRRRTLPSPEMFVKSVNQIR